MKVQECNDIYYIGRSGFDLIESRYQHYRDIVMSIEYIMANRLPNYDFTYETMFDISNSIPNDFGNTFYADRKLLVLMLKIMKMIDCDIEVVDYLMALCGSPNNIVNGFDYGLHFSEKTDGTVEYVRLDLFDFEFMCSLFSSRLGEIAFSINSRGYEGHDIPSLEYRWESFMIDFLNQMVYNWKTREKFSRNVESSIYYRSFSYVVRFLRLITSVRYNVKYGDKYTYTWHGYK